MDTLDRRGLSTRQLGSRFRPIAVVLAILMAVGLLGLAGVVRGQEREPSIDSSMPDVPSHDATGAMPGMDHETGMVVVPEAPSDGVLTIVIPPGTDAAMKQSGSASYHMPSVMRIKVGDTIVIRNDDTAPHMILYTFLLPGESDTRTFTEVGSEAYSSGCTANAAQFPDFTTIFIVDR